MDFPCLNDAINKSSWIFNQPNSTDDDNGWKKLCSTDCNGTIQNIGDPRKTCGCYLKMYSSNRHHEGKKNKGQNKKSKEYSIHPSSANSIKLNTVFERTNTLISKENLLKEKNNKYVNSELSYFSDRIFDDFKNFEDFGLPKVVKHDSEDCSPKRFTLFPEKSSSSPSILDGLSSYLKKNTSPRLRSLSDPQSKEQVPSPEKFKGDSPNSGFNYQNKSPGFNWQERSPGFNSQDKVPDCVASQIAALRRKIDELESEYMVKDETINENSDFPNIFNVHDSIEQTPILQEKTMNESFSSLYGLIPKSLFDCYSLQNQKAITTAENTHVFKRKENYLCHQKANPSNSLDVGINKPKFVVPHNSSDFYPFPPNMYHSLNYLPMNRQPLYCNIDPTGLSHEWISFLKKFQSLSTENERKIHGTENSASEMKDQGKKNYKKSHHNQQQQQSQPEMECKFCKSNMESLEMVKSHNLKQRVGRRTLVTCPVLRKLVCERCGETGDNAHTLSYCPRVIAESGRKPVSVAAELKKTRRVASGKMRKPF